MGTVYMVVSAGLFLLETILQFCVIGTHSKGSEALFVVLLALVMGPLIFVNFVSAIHVTRTQDFSGKGLGKGICIGFHAFQLGIVWRSLKLLILYDDKDWLDYLHMRLFHSGFQSLPFCIVLAYSMIVNETKAALDIVTIVFTLMSASVSLTTFRIGNKLFEVQDTEDRKFDVRKHVGVTFLTLSTLGVLISRSCSIVLFTVVKPLWIALPLGLHFITHLLINISQLKCSEEKLFYKICNAIYMSFVSIFDMVGKGYTGVKCSYVLYYTLMLIENIVFSFYWMLTAHFDERTKLLVVLMVLLCFIVGIIVKFASCGCIFNVESDILSDAFNNPELKETETKHIDNTVTDGAVKSFEDDTDITFHRVTEGGRHHEQNVATLSHAVESHMPNSKHSKPGSSSSSTSRLREYDNQAFVNSQGNISLSSQRSSNKRSHGSDNRCSSDSADVSCEFRTLSHSSQERSRGSKERSRDSHNQTRASGDRKRRGDKNKEHSKSGLTLTKQVLDAHIQRHERPPLPLKPKIIVSDTSKHANVTQTPVPPTKNQTKLNNISADFASSNSRYSRNTNTLNGSIEHYRYNGFEDPYREKVAFTKHLNHKSRLPRHFHQHSLPHMHNQSRGIRNFNYSLDSSELYPSTTSDTSSMTSYTVTDRSERIRRKQRQRARTRSRHLDSRDGYSTDVSNSDYLSYNDYSMEDSSSWTESSSSSDGAATWPPSHTANLLKMYNIPEKRSSTENIMHWLETMETEGSIHDTSFSTLHEPSLASDTDISLSAMQTFEVKKEKKKFKKLISKPKGLFLKFSSLNYKGKDKNAHGRQYPLNKIKAAQEYNAEMHTRKEQSHLHTEPYLSTHDTSHIPLPAMPLTVDSVQESIV